MVHFALDSDQRGDPCFEWRLPEQGHDCGRNTDLQELPSHLLLSQAQLSAALLPCMRRCEPR